MIQRYNQDAVTCTLHTTLNPKLIAVNGVNIELMELDPVPRLGITLYHWSYTAVFHLDPIYVPK